jgi:hypothetical protein
MKIIVSKLHYIIFLILCFGILQMNAQNKTVDSLEQELSKKAEPDTVRINLLNEIAYSVIYSDIEKTLRYARGSRQFINYCSLPGRKS